MEEKERATLRGQLAIAITLVLLSAVCLHQIATNELLHGNMGPDPGPAFMPTVLLLIIGIGGAVGTFLSAWRLTKHKASWGAEFPLRRLRSYAAPSLLVASLFPYVWMIPRAGYAISTFVFAAIWLPLAGVIMEGRRLKPSNCLISAFEAVLITAFLYGVFRYGIQVPLH